MAQIIISHEGIGVVPAIVGVGGSCFLINMVGSAPWQQGFVKADHQSSGAARSRIEHNALQRVIMVIIPDLIGRINWRGRIAALRFVFLAGGEGKTENSYDEETASHGNEFLAKVMKNVDCDKTKPAGGFPAGCFRFVM